MRAIEELAQRLREVDERDPRARLRNAGHEMFADDEADSMRLRITHLGGIDPEHAHALDARTRQSRRCRRTAR